MQLPKDDKVKSFLDGLNALGDRSTLDISPERFLEAATRGSSSPVSDELKAVYTALGNDARFKLSEPEEVVGVVKKLFSFGRVQGKSSDLLEGGLSGILDALSKQVGCDDHVAHFSTAHNAAIDGVLKEKTSAPTKPYSKIEQAYSRWNKLSPEHQINAGMFGTVALLSAFGFIRNIRNSFSKDPEGKNHFEWSAASIAIVQGIVALACSGLAVQAVRTGHNH